MPYIHSMNFSQFLLEAEEEEKNIQAMLKKLPKKHAALMKGFKFKYVPGNTLDGDDSHIGLIKGKTITVAGPWNYGREFTTLHEIAHMVWEKLMTDKHKSAWGALLKKTKSGHVKDIKGKNLKTDALDQNEEEIFCMAYAAAYCKHPSVIYHHSDWVNFIKHKIPG